MEAQAGAGGPLTTRLSSSAPQSWVGAGSRRAMVPVRVVVVMSVEVTVEVVVIVVVVELRWEMDVSGFSDIRVRVV